MVKFLKFFKSSEDGAVTVDWVVLTAAVIGLSGAAYGVIDAGVTGMGGGVNEAMSTAVVSTGTNNDANAGIITAGTN
ncbi:hypothetical protein OU790_00965 [Ruegeria sp. NA]|nr:hypothetical protein [Ruegeria sp. NA]MCX8951991.1 hypothetical protein [Ruegeria sp. NA]